MIEREGNVPFLQPLGQEKKKEKSMDYAVTSALIEETVSAFEGEGSREPLKQLREP